MGARPAAEEADPLQEFAIGHPGGSEDHVLAPCQVVGEIDPIRVIHVDAHPAAALLLLVRSPGEHGLDLATQAFQRRGGEHPFGGTAGAHHGVDTGS